MAEERITEELNRLLADATVFYQKLRHYHWNVDGRHFFELHAKFEELYDGWAVAIDQVAERILMVGGVPLHTLAAMLEHTSLQEDERVPPAPEMVERVESDMRALHALMGDILETAEAEGDRGTANLLDDLRDGLEKELWMLRSWGKEPASSWG